MKALYRLLWVLFFSANLLASDILKWPPEPVRSSSLRVGAWTLIEISDEEAEKLINDALMRQAEDDFVNACKKARNHD